VPLKTALTRVLVGNWAGAGLVAGATLLALLGAATGVGLLLKPEDLGWGDTLTGIVVLAGGAFGGDAFASAPLGSGELGLFPLGITLPVVAVAVSVFRRVTAGYTSSLAALLDGVRAAAMVAVPMAVLALVFRSEVSRGGRAEEDFAAEVYSEVFSAFGVYLDLSAGLSAISALFMTLLVVSAVLGLSVLTRRDWLPSRLARLHDWVAAPIAGLVTMLLLLPVAGLTAIAAVALTGDGTSPDELSGADEWMRAVGLLLAYLPNLGMAAMSLGAFGKVGYATDYDTNMRGLAGEASNEELWVRLTKFTGDGDEPGLWVLTVVVPVILLVCAYVVTRRSGSLQRVFRNVMVWAGAMVLVVPALTRLANLHAGFRSDFDALGGDLLDTLEVGRNDEIAVSMVVGVSVLSSTALLTLAALAAAAVMAALSGAISVTDIGSRFSAAARRLQATDAHQVGPTAQGDARATAASQAPPGSSSADRSS
jgi:hypothetical protein